MEILRSPSSVYLSPSRPARKVGSAGLLCPLLACDLYFHWGWSVRQFSLRESLSGGPAKHTKLSCALTIASRGLPRSCASRYPPPFGLRQPLKLYVSLLTSPSSHPMPFQTAATRSSASSLGRGRCGGLRLFRALGVQGFWGASASASCAGSYCFCSPWPLRSCPFLRCGSNTALKRTRILRAAYLVR